MYSVVLCPVNYTISSLLIIPLLGKLYLTTQRRNISLLNFMYIVVLSPVNYTMSSLMLLPLLGKLYLTTESLLRPALYYKREPVDRFLDSIN